MPSAETWQLSEESKSIYLTISYFNVFSRQQNKSSFQLSITLSSFFLSTHPAFAYGFSCWVQVGGEADAMMAYALMT